MCLSSTQKLTILAQRSHPTLPVFYLALFPRIISSCTASGCVQIQSLCKWKPALCCKIHLVLYSVGNRDSPFCSHPHLRMEIKDFESFVVRDTQAIHFKGNITNLVSDSLGPLLPPQVEFHLKARPSCLALLKLFCDLQ